jgi:osmoprotectant transport system permease protein
MSDFFALYGRRLLISTGTHFGYVLVSLGAGFVIAFFLGIALSRLPRLGKIILPLLSLFQTIPGIVFIGILFLYRGMRPSTVIIALSIYAIFPILKNTYVGLTGLEERYLEAARGCGMSPLQSLLRVEIPMALPLVLAGLRMSAVYTVSWAVLSAMIGLGGLGELIYAGVSSNNNVLILAGAVPAALMALLFSFGMDLLRRLLVRGPRRNIRREARG